MKSKYININVLSSHFHLHELTLSHASLLKQEMFLVLSARLFEEKQTFHNGHNCHIRNLIGRATCYPSISSTRISAKFFLKNLRKFHENISASHMPQHEQQIMTRREIFYEFSMNRSHWRVHLLQ